MNIPSTTETRYIRQGNCLRCGWCCLSEDCEHLGWYEQDGEMKAHCLIAKSPERPQRCKLFPQAPPLLNEDCGYFFLDRWEGKRRVKIGRDL